MKTLKLTGLSTYSGPRVQRKTVSKGDVVAVTDEHAEVMLEGFEFNVTDGNVPHWTEVSGEEVTHDCTGAKAVARTQALKHNPRRLVGSAAPQYYGEGVKGTAQEEQEEAVETSVTAETPAADTDAQESAKEAESQTPAVAPEAPAAEAKPAAAKKTQRVARK